MMRTSLLMGEITNALETLQKARRPSFSLVDDALKNAGFSLLPEHVQPSVTSKEKAIRAQPTLFGDS